MDAILEGEEKEGEGEGTGKENAEETEKMEGDEEQGSAVDGQTDSIAENDDELSENLEPSAPFDDEETSQMSMGSKGTQATQESKET